MPVGAEDFRSWTPIRRTAHQVWIFTLRLSGWAAVEALRAAVAECERKLTAYGALVDAGERSGRGRRMDRRDRS
jgi:hypothetical protein